MIEVESPRGATADGTVAETRAVILGAARAALEEHGVRRTTVADIARRSGMSRQTIYRYWPDVTALYADVLTSEMRNAVSDETTAGSLDGMVEALVATAAHVRDLPLLRRLRETDPELLARYILERLGTSQHDILARLELLVTAGQAAGVVRAGQPQRMAAMVLLIVQSAVQSAPLVADRLPVGVWEAELAAALRGYVGEPAR
ncbi:MAG: TetR/AcrR family transcriptional regulator [Microbacterium sp.]|uniref:TetR/AcrR family transcriptional regulator n=1 Tax=Microbacterium sp. TaxID=51671 RepID=UPI003A8673B0